MAPRILIVDDDPIVIQITAKVLAAAGYEVFKATDGPEALKQVDDIRPDLIILDVMMPEINGYEVCRRLRAKPSTAHLPIMMLTAQESLEEKVRGFEAGADDYMTKPFQPAELQARVKVLLRRAVTTEGAAAQLAGKVIAAFSLRGGVGVSSLTANLAVGLAQLWNCPTVLVDLSLMAGHSALMLNLAQRNTWADLAQIPMEEIDAKLVNELLLPHGSGAFLLAAPRKPEDSESINGECVTRVLTVLREHYHYIVLDLPHDFRETTLAGLDLAHDILAITSPDLASVLSTASTLDIFETLHYSRDTIRLVLNQTFERNALAQKVIEDALKRPFNLVIPFATEVAQSINVGKPVVMSAPATSIGIMLEDLAFRVSKDEHRKQRPEHPTQAWQRVARRLSQKK
jgi:pilus assembly protein CpaE